MDNSDSHGLGGWGWQLEACEVPALEQDQHKCFVVNAQRLAVALERELCDQPARTAPGLHPAPPSGHGG